MTAGGLRAATSRAADRHQRSPHGPCEILGSALPRAASALRGRLSDSRFAWVRASSHPALYGLAAAKSLAAVSPQPHHRKHTTHPWAYQPTVATFNRLTMFGTRGLHLAPTASITQVPPPPPGGERTCAGVPFGTRIVGGRGTWTSPRTSRFDSARHSPPP